MEARDCLSREMAGAALAQMAEAHYALLDANLAVENTTPRQARYSQAVEAIDALSLLLGEAKWHLQRATGDCAEFSIPSGSRRDAERANALFSEIISTGRALAAWLQGTGPCPPLPDAQARLLPDHEIFRCGEAPIVPSICPVVLLAGGWHAMGAQYFEQCLEIFGPFVFERAAARSFSASEQEVIGRWEAQLLQHAPHVHAFALGMAEGSRTSAVALSNAQALALWTGWIAPHDKPQELGVPDSMTASIMSYFGALRDAAQSPAQEADLCSGVAVWGEGSKDGGLIAGATTDHDCTFQVTIVGYPDGGERFIYTPFSVNGSVPGIGMMHFAGLPGVNGRGLAYVHHGGAIGACAEPRELWGYGIRRGASTFEVLATCTSTEQALERELSWPVSDTAAIMGSPGGFYADRHSGYVLESRGAPALGVAPIARRHTADRAGLEREFLYANNNVLDPRSGSLFFPPAAGYRFEPEAGWFVLEEREIGHPSAAIVGRRMWTKSSESRNRYLHAAVSAQYGRFDLATMRAVYEQGPRFPPEPWAETERRWKAGERLHGSTSHRGNAFTALIDATPGRDPQYWGCVGSASHRAVRPNRSGHGYFYFDETFTFWNLSLAAKPAELIARARRDAQQLLKSAEDALALHPQESLVLMRGWLRRGQEAWAAAHESQSVSNASLCVPLAAQSRTLRQLCRAQVRARQVLKALGRSVDVE